MAETTETGVAANGVIFVPVFACCGQTSCDGAVEGAVDAGVRAVNAVRSDVQAAEIFVDANTAHRRCGGKWCPGYR